MNGSSRGTDIETLSLYADRDPSLHGTGWSLSQEESEADEERYGKYVRESSGGDVVENRIRNDFRETRMKGSSEEELNLGDPRLVRPVRPTANEQDKLKIHPSPVDKAKTPTETEMDNVMESPAEECCVLSSPNTRLSVDVVKTTPTTASDSPLSGGRTNSIIADDLVPARGLSRLGHSTIPGTSHSHVHPMYPLLHSSTTGSTRSFSLGICAMECKVNSSPMNSILKRLKKSGDFTIVKFPENMILESSIDTWPKVDCLIAFHSAGFPLDKVINYVNLQKPIVLNDLPKQKLLRNRLSVYKMLATHHIPHPNYVVVDHLAIQRGESTHTFVEHYDYIVYNNIQLNKPFIEKPIDADNHNNWIYYPKNTGGGCKKLFRKVKDRSSQYLPDVHNVRRDGVYVYEEFLSTFGTDIKVYTVGQIFAHAEARKAPSLDGKVKRSADGKEVRYPVLLTENEKLIAYRIVETFSQVVCGFDILRTTHGPPSVICDVNGWSFVKGNVKYYNDCAHIVRALFLTKLQEKYHFIPRELPYEWFAVEAEEETLRRTFIDVEEEIIHQQSRGCDHEELCTVVVVMRHGDRKPKQKLKFETTDNRILGIFNQKHPYKQVKLKSPEELKDLLERNTLALEDLEGAIEQCRQRVSSCSQDECENSRNDPNYSQDMLSSSPPCGHLVTDAEPRVTDVPTLSQHLKELEASYEDRVQLQRVLLQGDGFTGINRKIQLKPIGWIKSAAESPPSVSAPPLPSTTTGLMPLSPVVSTTPVSPVGVATETSRSTGVSSLLTSPVSTGTIWGSPMPGSGNAAAAAAGLVNQVSRCLVVAKWGGELTGVGRAQAEDLGKRFRATLYPGDSAGLLRLHSTFRHDFKIYSSDEGRCQVTSAAFTKGFLDLEGELTPILVQLVIRNAKAHSLLDDSQPQSTTRKRCKDLINDMLNKDIDLREHPDLVNKVLSAEYSRGHRAALVHTGNPYRTMQEIYQNLRRFIEALEVEIGRWKQLLPSDKYAQTVVSLLKEIRRRWRQLLDGWYKTKTKTFDTSKVPDIVDNVRFDLIHHHAPLGLALDKAIEIYNLVEPLSNFAAPAEYGLTGEDKLEIGVKVVEKLLKKIIGDLTFFRGESESRDAGRNPGCSGTAPASSFSRAVTGSADSSFVCCDTIPAHVPSEAPVNYTKLTRPSLSSSVSPSHQSSVSGWQDLCSIGGAESRMESNVCSRKESAVTHLLSGLLSGTAVLGAESSGNDEGTTDGAELGWGSHSKSPPPPPASRPQPLDLGVTAAQPPELLRATRGPTEICRRGRIGGDCGSMLPDLPSTDTHVGVSAKPQFTTATCASPSFAASSAVVINRMDLWAHQRKAKKEDLDQLHIHSPPSRSDFSYHCKHAIDRPPLQPSTSTGRGGTESPLSLSPGSPKRGPATEPAVLPALQEDQIKQNSHSELKAPLLTRENTNCDEPPARQGADDGSLTTVPPVDPVHVDAKEVQRADGSRPRRSLDVTSGRVRGKSDGVSSREPSLFHQIRSSSLGVKNIQSIGNNVVEKGIKGGIGCSSRQHEKSWAQSGVSMFVRNLQPEKSDWNGLQGEDEGSGDAGTGEEEDEDNLEEERDHIRLKEEEARALGIRSPWRIVRSRYYVTSSSHLQSLLNILMYANHQYNASGSTPETDLYSLSAGRASSPCRSASRMCNECEKRTAAAAGAGSERDVVEANSPESQNIRVSNEPSSGRSNDTFLSPSSDKFSTLGEHRQWFEQDAQARPASVEPCLGGCGRLIRYQDDGSADSLNDVTDLHYLSHIVFRVWENKRVAEEQQGEKRSLLKESSDKSKRYRLEIQFSSGAKDGFGQNYELLQKDAKEALSKFHSRYYRHTLTKIQQEKQERLHEQLKQQKLLPKQSVPQPSGRAQQHWEDSYLSLISASSSSSAMSPDSSTSMPSLPSEKTKAESGVLTNQPVLSPPLRPREVCISKESQGKGENSEMERAPSRGAGVEAGGLSPKAKAAATENLDLLADEPSEEQQVSRPRRLPHSLSDPLFDGQSHRQRTDVRIMDSSITDGGGGPPPGPRGVADQVSKLDQPGCSPEERSTKIRPTPEGCCTVADSQGSHSPSPPPPSSPMPSGVDACATVHYGTSSNSSSKAHHHRDVFDDVPPYCELSPLIPLSKHFELTSFEVMMNAVIQKFKGSVTSSKSVKQQSPVGSVCISSGSSTATLAGNPSS